MTKLLRTGVVAAALFAPIALSPVQAQTTLRYSDYLPTTHYLTVQGSQPFMDAVAAATNGAVNFQHFPAQQLGQTADFLRLTQDNVAQISVVGVSFLADAMELSNVAQMPGAFDSACAGLDAYNAILDTTPLRELDFTRHGVKLLMSYVLPQFEVVSTFGPITGIEDFRGRVILVATRAAELLLNEMGGAPIQTTAGTSAYEMVTRGTIDGLIFAADSTVAYDLHSVTRYGTTNGGFGGMVVAVIMNQSAFDALDSETQAIIEAEAERAERAICEYVDKKNSEALETIAASGVELTTFPDEVLAEIAVHADAVATRWAEELGSRGVPGGTVLEAYRAAIAAN